jgi:MFS family permease
MKVDLGLSDTDLGLLGGTAFALLYAFSGIPIARLAERFNRVTIIASALVVWSSLTALCGAAANFSQLVLLRIGVGAGEAGCSPPAHSLISDYFEPERRASALSVYSTGISIGYLFGAVVGGYVAHRFGWRAACVTVGLPGIVVAILVKRWIEEPPRGYSEPSTAGAPPRSAAARVVVPFSLLTELRELGAVARALLLRWPIANMVAGVVLASFASYGSWAFVPPYFRREFGLDLGTIGLISGLAGGVSVGLGTLAGGAIADYLGRSSPRWYALVPAIGLSIAMPIYMLAFQQPTWQSTALVLSIPGFFQYAYLGPTFGVVQNVVDSRQRATATALLFMLLNVLALGCGPVFTGWASDLFAGYSFTHPESGSLAAALLGVFSHPDAGSASFALSCPGGQAPPLASAAAAAACSHALALATRQGILVTLAVYGWAALHYLLGAIGLEREMRAAAARNAGHAPAR